MPIISGRPSLSYHAHTAPVTFIMTLAQPQYSHTPPKPDSKAAKKVVKVNSPKSTPETTRKLSEPIKPSSTINSDQQTAAKCNRSASNCDQSSYKANKATTLENLRKSSTLPRGFGGLGEVEAMNYSLEAEDITTGAWQKLFYSPSKQRKKSKCLCVRCTR